MHDSGPVILYDDALEGNRRRAWACFFRQKQHTEQVAYWGAEIAEHLEQEAAAAGVELHPDVVELIDLIRASLPAGGRAAIARYVNRVRNPGPAEPQEDLDDHHD